MAEFDKTLGIATAGLQAQNIRLRVIAENIANADTPGYKAKDLEPFSEAYARSERTAMDAGASGFSQRAFHAERIKTAGVASPDGNTVSLEDQMTRSTEAVRQHDTALTVYSKALSMLRATLGGRG